ncbi:MAG: hypothetical protein IIA91_07660 [Chloroflexi bacterium]|nr:hypothetical protein [Chloroflexota bacterium]
MAETPPTLPWSVFGSGGGSSSSTNFESGSTSGQAGTIGKSTSTNYELVAGYWGRALDSDVDGDPNISDICPNDADDDGDGDGICVGNGFKSPKTGDNDNCPTVPNTDQANDDGDEFGNVCDLCPTVYTPWVVPVGDTDCDRFTDVDEVYLDTNPNVRCPANDGPDNEGLPDVWPFDFYDNQRADLSDVLGFIPVFNLPASTPALKRFDLDINGLVGLADVLSFIPVFNYKCTP